MLHSVPKVKTPRDDMYKAFIRRQPCLLKGGRHGVCLGGVHAHHTETGGMSLKGSDYSCIPLCAAHHHDMDNAGKKGVGIWAEEQLAAIITRLKEQYRKQGGIINE